jgi:hypothetical protein
MRVRELIERLSKADQNSEVYVCFGEHGVDEAEGVTIGIRLALNVNEPSFYPAGRHEIVANDQDEKEYKRYAKTTGVFIY